MKLKENEERCIDENSHQDTALFSSQNIELTVLNGEPGKENFHKEKERILCMYTIYAGKHVDFWGKSDRIKFYTGFISKHA